MNLVTDLLSVGAPDAVAVFAGQREVSFGELRERVGQVACHLIARGARKQERIGIWSENSVFHVVSYLGVIRAGLVAVPFQTDAAPETVVGILGEASIRTVLVSARFVRQCRGWLATRDVEIIGESELLAARGAFDGDFPAIEPTRDLAALMFTSGSTGKPKGVMVTHRNIACNTGDIVRYMGLRPADRAMVVLPFHYCFGLSLLHSHLAAGASIVISNQFLYPERVLREMQSRACTGLAGVPSTYQILLRRSRFREMSFPSLRWLQQAGGKLPNACIQEVLSAFPGVRFYVMYGQTEATARLSYLPPECLVEKLGSVGKGLPSTRLEVLRPDGTPVQAGSGEVGEIVASGDNIALGYWRNPQETDRYFRNGKLHTGDLARVDADGFIYIVEREREIIKCGGNRVSAKEIEEAVAELPEVVEVAVVGVHHEILGEAAIAFVVLAPDGGMQLAAVEAHCRRRLPAFKVPVQIIPLARMPHGGSGKVAKTELKHLATSMRVEERSIGLEKERALEPKLP